MAGLYADCNLTDPLPNNLNAFSWRSVSQGATQVVPRVKQFELRIAGRPGLPSEIASALWEKGVHIQAFSAELQEGQGIFHLAVDKALVAMETFMENGWKATEEGGFPS
jgi:hypothetical protein